jgi:hypothetical protein
MRASTGTGITAKAQLLIHSWHAILIITAESLRQAGSNSGTIRTTTTSISIHPGDDVVPKAAGFLTHWLAPPACPGPQQPSPSITQREACALGSPAPASGNQHAHLKQACHGLALFLDLIVPNNLGRLAQHDGC